MRAALLLYLALSFSIMLSYYNIFAAFGYILINKMILYHYKELVLKHFYSGSLQCKVTFHISNINPCRHLSFNTPLSSNCLYLPMRVYGPV